MVEADLNLKCLFRVTIQAFSDFKLCSCVIIPFTFFVGKIDEEVTECGAIEPDKEEIRQEPYSLPQGFEWDTLDIADLKVASKTN